MHCLLKWIIIFLFLVDGSKLWLHPPVQTANTKATEMGHLTLQFLKGCMGLVSSPLHFVHCICRSVRYLLQLRIRFNDCHRLLGRFVLLRRHCSKFPHFLYWSGWRSDHGVEADPTELHANLVLPGLYYIPSVRITFLDWNWFQHGKLLFFGLWQCIYNCLTTR